MIVNGYFMENPADAAVLGFGPQRSWLRRAVITWKVGKLINFPIIKYDKWHANVAKRKDVLR